LEETTELDVEEKKVFGVDYCLSCGEVANYFDQTGQVMSRKKATSEFTYEHQYNCFYEGGAEDERIEWDFFESFPCCTHCELSMYNTIHEGRVRVNYLKFSIWTVNLFSDNASISTAMYILTVVFFVSQTGFKCR